MNMSCTRKNKSDYLGVGKYGCVKITMFGGTLCAVKAVQRYKDKPENSSPSLKASVDKEEDLDVTTEIAILSSTCLNRDLNWRCLPHMYAALKHCDIEDATMNTIRSSLEFTPAALIYMEILESRLDHYIIRNAVNHHGSDESLRLMCDLMSAVVALHRNGIRHNDLMLRNVMVRKRKIAERKDRELTLSSDGNSGSKKTTFKWKSNSKYDIVLIDFGLSSFTSDKAPSGAITHALRDELYADDSMDARQTKGPVHPLVLPANSALRDCIDLHCIGHSLRALSSTLPLHTAFKLWCKNYVKILNYFCRLNVKKVSPEHMVSRLLPVTVCRRIKA